jgi:Fe-S-cluster containining protein
MTQAPFAVLYRRPYFFDAGLHFECLKCGQCCTGAPGTIYVSAEEIEALAGHLRMSVARFTAHYLYPYKESFSIGEHADGRCFFFDDGCSIYPLRPHQCRTFPFWFSNLRSESRWRDVTGQCPGIGRGRRYSREQILEIVQTTWFI